MLADDDCVLSLQKNALRHRVHLLYPKIYLAIMWAHFSPVYLEYGCVPTVIDEKGKEKNRHIVYIACTSFEMRMRDSLTGRCQESRPQGILY
jgi:hypothetical protein